MLKNYVKIAFRNLARHRGRAATNVFGLAVAVGAVIVLGLFVAYERSFDDFHEKADRIYALGESLTRGGETNSFRLTRTPALPQMLQEIPEVENGARLQGPSTQSFGYGERRYRLDVVMADSGFFDVFTFPGVRGDVRAAVTQPGTVALTETAARRIFGDTDPLGQTLDLNFGRAALTVVAILADPPSNSTLRFDAVGAWLNLPEGRRGEAEPDWYSSNAQTYVLMRAGVRPATLEAKLHVFQERHYEKYPNTLTELWMQPITELRAAEAGNGPLLAALALIAAAILLIAGINFTNLATAQALERAREIGMRKVLGARRRQLAAQFLGESVLTCGLALVLGVGLAWLALPFFNELFGLELRVDLQRQMPALLVLWGLLGVTAGLYPALYLSGLQPVASMRGGYGRSRSGSRLRQGLVVVQFALSVFLIAGTLVVWRQVDFMKTQDVRFDRENVLVMPVETAPLGEAADARLASVRDALLRSPLVRSASFSQSVPGRYYENYNVFYPNGDVSRDVRLRQISVDARFFETYGMTFGRGKGFSPDALTDNERRVVINEAAARVLGEDPLQTRLTPGGWDASFEIAGVVQDYFYRSAAGTVEPLIHFYGGDAPGRYNYLSVRIQPGEAEAGVALLREQWQALYPALDFSYFFVDDEFDALYRAQERFGLIGATFAGLAVLIACLGLLALAAFTIQARTKEIGVRKALGATVPQIVLLLSRDVARLVLVAAVVAAPVAYAVMHRWLDGFAHRIELSGWVFALAGLAALAVALATVSYQSVRAAMVDPVKSLRYE